MGQNKGYSSDLEMIIRYNNEEEDRLDFYNDPKRTSAYDQQQEMLQAQLGAQKALWQQQRDLEELAKSEVEKAGVERIKRKRLKEFTSTLEFRILAEAYRKTTGLEQVPKFSFDEGFYGDDTSCSIEIAEELDRKRIREPMLYFIPEDFKNVTFKDFEIQCEGQEIAWTLLTHYGTNPPRGLYMHGNYGTGKTHLISAFARGLRTELTANYLQDVGKYCSNAFEKGYSKLKLILKIEDKIKSLHEEYNNYTERILKGYNQYGNQYSYSTLERCRRGAASEESLDQIKEGEAYLKKLGAKDTDNKKELFKLLEKEISPLQKQVETLESELLPFKEALKQSLYQHKPTDLAFATFDFIFDQRSNEDLIKEFLARKIVIIDDIHPKGDTARIEFIQRVIEYRYNEVRTGATFITSNLSMDQLVLRQDYPKEIAERVHSRLQEMCMPIEFKADDYRLKKAKKANAELLEFARKLKKK